MISVDSIQQIAKGVVETSSACDGQLYTGTVTSSNPLKIKLGIDVGDIELEGDDIILTQSVVSKKLYIKKHTHKIGSDISSHTHVVAAESPFAVTGSCVVPLPTPATPTPGTITGTATGTAPMTKDFTSETEIVTSTLDAWVTEYGHKLPRDPDKYDMDGEQVCITINRSLQKGDSVIMSRVSHGQQFIVLSRYFPVDKAGGDDEGDE